MRVTRKITAALVLVALHAGLAGAQQDTPQPDSLPQVEAAAKPAKYLQVLHVGYVPFRVVGGGYRIQMNEKADQSGVPSAIELGTLDYARSLSIGLSIYDREGGVAIDTEFAPRGDLSSFLVGAGYRPLLPLGRSSVRLAPRVGMDVTYVSGQLGEVGNVNGDQVLVTPDGEHYGLGSTIHAQGFAFGGGAGAGIVVGRGDVQGLIDLGYRWTTEVRKWGYEVRDAEDPERSSTLPSEGFEQSPPPFSARGWTMRFGVALSNLF